MPVYLRRAHTPRKAGHGRIRADRGVMPDLQFVRPGGRPVPDRGLAHGAPDLAVEVVSPSSVRWDRVVKLAWYSAIGTAEYWIVDPQRRRLERFLPTGDGTLRLADAHAGDARFAPATCPELEIELARLWTMPEL